MSNEQNYNIQVEQNIIGVMLLNQDSISNIINDISPDDFYTNSCSYLCTIIFNMHTDGKLIDKVTVYEQVKFEQMTNLVTKDMLDTYCNNIQTTNNIKQLIKILIKYSKRRKLIEIIENNADSLLENKDVDQVLYDMSNQIEELKYKGASNNMTTIFSGIDTVLENIDSCYDSPDGLFGLPTGFDKLDHKLGGLCGGRTYLIGARPRSGKSTLAQQIAEFVAQNNVVLFQSLEMPTAQYTKRSLFRRAGIDNDIILNKQYNKDTVMDMIINASTQLSQSKLLIDDNPYTTIETVEKNINILKEKYGTCDLVVIDYAQLMEHKNKKLSRFEKASENSINLKRLAKKYDVPILLLCQLNRCVEGRANPKPILSDLKDSGSYEQDADVIMFIHRPELYNDDPRLKGETSLIIAKNREGSAGEIRMCFNETKCEFKEI